MMVIRLKRFSYSPTETEGVLIIGDERFATIERPWIHDPKNRAGKRGESCIPDGMYRLSPHVRPSGEECYLVWNQDLGVYRTPQERGQEPGRDLILIHAGNYASDVKGCIAPGLRRGPLLNAGLNRLDYAVHDSAAAMRRIRKLLGGQAHVLAITNDTGAYNV